MNLFSQGDYIRALSEDSMAEAISKVLYPADDHNEGKILRLKQQYFWFPHPHRILLTAI